MKRNLVLPLVIAAAAVCHLAPASAEPAQASTRNFVTTFSDGAKGWKGPTGNGGATFIDDTLGNGAPALHTQFEDFGITFRNKPSAAKLAGLKLPGSVELSLDVNTYSVVYFFQNVTRDLVVELRDYDNPPEGYPYAAVWARIGTLDAKKTGWQHMGVTIADTRATELPAGWGGYGAEDAVANPILPAGRSFADVVAGADEIAFTTLVPGWAFGFTNFDVAVDNLAVRPAAKR
ncbi:MAG TPA: PEP-CTERM sorting domain-containing protein [Ideonella sp.]|nr:PEP-CTERM sorting domain-containing protein [Ideonella sp.]